MLKEYISSGENMASSLLAGAAGVVPLALLAYKGVNSLNSSTPLVSPIRQETSSSIMGDALGKAARAKQAEHEKKLLDKTEAIKKKFTDGTAKSTWMDRVKRSADARARNLQTFATFLQDPNLELTDIQKNKLTALISSAVADENLDLEPLWDEVIDPLIKQNNTELLGEFERVRRSYGKVGSLVPTVKAMVPESPLQSIRIDDDKSEAAKLLGKIKQKLGNNYSVEGHMLSIGDEQVPVARIYSRGKRGQNFETLMPLSDSPLFAAGEQFQTIKSAPRYVVDARRAANLVRTATSLDDLVKRGGAIGLHQYSYELLDEFQEENGRWNLRGFRQAQEELLVGVSRGIANDSELAKHIAYQAKAKSSRMVTVGLSGMSTDAALNIQIAMAKLNGVDPAGAGEKRILEGHGEGRRGVLGIANFRRGSRVEPATIATAWSNAFDLPKHSISLGFRESQLVGREKMPIGGTRMIGASGNVPLGVVTGARDVYAHSDVMGTATGRIGMVVWNTDKASYRDLNKTGAAYSGRKFQFKQSMTPTVLDAERMGLPFESEFIRDLKTNGSRRLTAAELKNPIYLGEQADGSPYYLRANPGDLGMTVKLQNAPNVSISKGQKPLLQLVVEADREVDMAKLFSVIHKGNAEFVDRDLLKKYIARDFDMDVVQGALEALGVDFEDLLITNSNMVSKSWVAHEALISQQAVAFSKGNLTVGKIRDAVQKLDPKHQDLIAEMVGTHNMTPEVKASRTHLAKYAIAAVTSMKDVDPAHLGNVLCGLNFGTSADDKLEASGLERLLDMVISDPKSKVKALEGMRFGASFVPDISAIGEQKFDWGESTASMDPRAAMQLFERLKVAGVSTKDALKVVTKLHEGQSNFLPMFKIATGLNSVVQSMHGLYGPMDYISDTAEGIKRLTFNEFKAGVVASDGDVIGFLKRYKKGSILDMGDAPDQVRSVFKEVYRGTEIRLPGSELFSAMKGTKVRVNASTPDINIDNAVEVQLKSLTERLFGAGTDVQRLRIGLKGVRDEMDGLLVQSMSGLTKGKVRGSASPISRFFSLDDTSIHSLEAKKLAWGRKLFRKTTGRMAFYDTDAFLSQLGSTKGALSLNRRADMAEAFFMGGEWRDANRARGISVIAGRDPILTAGNFSMVEVFRHPDEIARLGGEDKFFKTFAESAHGKSMLSRYFDPSRAGSMQSFGDVLSALGTGKDTSSKRHQFFKEFVSNLSDFYNFSQSGSVSMPVFRVGPKGEEVDIGFSAAAYLDNDGDHVKTFMLSKEEQRIFRQAVGNQAYQEDDLLFRLFSQKMGDQSKKALGNIKAKLAGLAGADLIDNEIKKGVTLAIRTGPLDVSLQRLHSAMFDYAGDNMSDAMFNQGILGTVLETFALKSKKLPIATDYPQEFKLVTDALMDNPNEENAAAFKRLIGEAYEGTDFGGKGFTVDLSPIAEVDPKLAARLGSRSRTFSADSWTDYVISAARSAYSNGTNRSTSEGARRALLANNPEEFRRIFNGGADVASAAMRAFTDEADIAAKASYAGSAMRSNFLNLDRMATGQLALALGVGAVLSGIVGMSHSSAPMIDPNEALPAASVRDAIAQNNLFTGGSDEIPRDYPSAEVGYSSQNIAYLERPNTYQIKGRVGSQGALQSISGDYRMMTGGAGRGSVVVNDRRTPITSNYIDRLLGEY